MRYMGDNSQAGQGYVGIGDPNAGDAPVLPRDLLARQGATRANALRRMGTDFLMPGNRAPGIGSPFTAGKGMGFQMPGNAGVIPKMTAGTQLSDVNAPPLTFDQVVRQGMVPPPLKTLPRNPYFQGMPQGPGATYSGFMIPANRPKT